jgi:enterochelin esterase-like enzyme
MTLRLASLAQGKPALAALAQGRIVLAALAHGAFLLASSAWLAAQAPPAVVSPDVSADRRVTFRLRAPGANDVQIAGEFMQGSKPLVKGEDGVWSLTIGPLDPEIYHYTFSVDGVRTIDPGNAIVKTGSTASTIASVLEVPAGTPAFYEARQVPHGEMHQLTYQSSALGTTRRVTVYVPPGYERNPKMRYPVLYLLHGANGDENVWYRLGRVNAILDNLIAENRAKSFLVVMPNGYGVVPNAPQEPGQNTERFGKDLVDDVVPLIESRYRVVAGRDARALVGLSMGGGQALAIGLNRLDLFSHVGGFSSGFGPNFDFGKSYPRLLESAQSTNRQLRLLWIGCGTDDGAFAASKRFSEFLTVGGIVHTFRETAGAHTWMVWRRYLHEVAPLLFK